MKVQCIIGLLPLWILFSQLSEEKSLLVYLTREYLLYRNADHGGKDIATTGSITYTSKMP